MNGFRKTINTLLTAMFSCSVLVAANVGAQSYPVKPVRILLGYGTGGSTDTTARLVAQQLTEHLGRQFLVENRPGATGTIALDLVAKAPPDGYTTIVIAAADTIVPTIRNDLPYNLEKDFSPIAYITYSPYLLVAHVGVPADDLKSLIAYARANPGKLNYSSSGVGSSAHIAGEMMNIAGKLSTTHIPYKGSAEGAAAIASGDVQLSFPSVTGAMGMLKAGRIKAIAVTSANRSALAPNVPTMNESGLPGFVRTGWYGMLGPAGMPRDIVNKLNSLIGEIVTKPDVKDLLFKQGLESERITPEQFAALIKREIEQNREVVKAVNLKPN
jgi:tripartite-type tricarboxylate transporter receptor subunit TctC